jgi:hypothetical protein
MTFVLSGGRRYDENVIAVGAQSERRGDAWPARGLLGGKDLAGRLYSEDQRVRRTVGQIRWRQP